MQKTLTLVLLPSEAADDHSVKQYIAQAIGVKTNAVTGFNIMKHSIDARGKLARIHLTIHAYIDEPAVAFIEINNENGLIMEWNNGSLDPMPDPFAAELRV